MTFPTQLLQKALLKYLLAFQTTKLVSKFSSLQIMLSYNLEMRKRVWHTLNSSHVNFHTVTEIGEILIKSIFTSECIRKGEMEKCGADV